MFGLCSRCFGEGFPAPVRKADALGSVYCACEGGKIQVQLEGRLQIRNDLWRSGVGNVLKGKRSVFRDQSAECGSHLLVVGGKPLQEGAHGFDVEPGLRIFLALAQAA